ncbi:MAG: alpha/beta hydrolase family protein [Anaerolineae bacterium]
MPEATQTGGTRLYLSQNDLLDNQYVRALSYGAYDAASPGEIMRIAADLRGRPSTRANWIAAWQRQGERARELAEAAEAAGHRFTARAAYLRAYNYLRCAEFYFPRAQPEAHRALYMQSVACFDKAIALLETPVQRVDISYIDGISLPGYVFDPAGAPRGTVIVCGGGDSYGEETYFTAGVPQALERGLRVIAFHGPGQRGLLHRHPDRVFRPDYEVPIGAVVDFALALPGTDPQRLALYGYSLGGYLAPRAAACGPRIRALVANAPMMNFHDFILGGVLTVLPGLLQPVVNRMAENRSDGVWDWLGERSRAKDWPYDATFELYMGWTNGVHTFSDYLEATQRYNLDGLVERITCPTLCISAEGEGPEPIKQTVEFYERLAAPKDLITLRIIDGADNHCGMNNIPHTSALVYVWINDVFDGIRPEPAAA